MPNTERIVAQWISGAPERALTAIAGTSRSAGPLRPAGRTVVVDTDDWIPALVSSGMIDPATALISRGGGVASPAGWNSSHVGSFDGSGADLVFGDGFRLRLTRYGLADFSSLDTPTALVLGDEHDFSAFLRDADTAWATGSFADHITHPQAVLANVAALGAGAARSGPDHRLFVAADGSVSTSPFGAWLGEAGDNPALVAARWRAAHATELPDAVSLHTVIRPADRSDALGERPWLTRYLQVAAVIRDLRGEHLQPGPVSGFGSHRPDPDDGERSDTGLPVIVEAGGLVRLIDPASGAWTILPAALATTAHRLLDGAPGVGRPQSRDLAAALTQASLPTGWLLATTPPVELT